MLTSHDKERKHLLADEIYSHVTGIISARLHERLAFHLASSTNTHGQGSNGQAFGQSDKLCYTHTRKKQVMSMLRIPCSNTLFSALSPLAAYGDGDVQ